MNCFTGRPSISWALSYTRAPGTALGLGETSDDGRRSRDRQQRHTWGFGAKGQKGFSLTRGLARLGQNWALSFLAPSLVLCPALLDVPQEFDSCLSEPPASLEMSSLKPLENPTFLPSTPQPSPRQVLPPFLRFQNTVLSSVTVVLGEQLLLCLLVLLICVYCIYVSPTSRSQGW